MRTGGLRRSDDGPPSACDRRKGEQPMGPLRYSINGTLDVSGTLDQVDWNAQLVQGDLAKAIQLKQ